MTPVENDNDVFSSTIFTNRYFYIYRYTHHYEQFMTPPHDIAGTWRGLGTNDVSHHLGYGMFLFLYVYSFY